MKIIKSDRLPLPRVYYVESEDDLKSLPMGIPFIRGNAKDYRKVVRVFEFEFLMKSYLKTGLPFNWNQLLKDNGFKSYEIPEASSNGESGIGGDKVRDENEFTVEEFLADTSYVVDLEMLKNLKLLPDFYNITEESIKANIHNSIIFNPTLYNKKLGLPIGSTVINEVKRNCIIIDASSSIPVSIATTNLLLAKTMSLNYYADLLVTGAISILYDYSEIQDLDVDEVYSKIGRNNDQVYFMEIMKQTKEYNTIIAFGDNHNPCQRWNGNYPLELEEAKSMCKWKVNKLISGHVDSNEKISGYAILFEPFETEILQDWTKYLN